MQPFHLRCKEECGVVSATGIQMVECHSGTSRRQRRANLQQSGGGSFVQRNTGTALLLQEHVLVHGKALHLSGYLHGLGKELSGGIVPVKSMPRSESLGAQGFCAFLQIIPVIGGMGIAHGHERRLDGRIDFIHRSPEFRTEPRQTVRIVGTPRKTKLPVLRLVQSLYQLFSGFKAAVLEPPDAIRTEAGVRRPQIVHAAVVIHPYEVRLRLRHDVGFPAHVRMEFRRGRTCHIGGRGSVIAYHDLIGQGRS